MTPISAPTRPHRLNGILTRAWQLKNTRRTERWASLNYHNKKRHFANFMFNPHLPRSFCCWFLVFAFTHCGLLSDDQQGEPKWSIPLQALGMGSHEFPEDNDPLYAGPNPDSAPECATDNYLGLILDTAPGAKVQGCYFNFKDSLALGGPSRRHNTRMDAKVEQNYCIWAILI